MAPIKIQGKLRALRARLRAFFVLDGVSRLAAVSVAIISVSIFFDWLTSPKLPGFMRWAMLATGLGAIGWVLWKRLVSPLRVGLSEDDMAIAVERANPDLRDSLISTVQLARVEAGPQFGASREMVGKLVSATSAATATMDFRSIINARKMRGQLLAGTGAALFALAVTAAAPNSVLTGLTRYFAPFSGARWKARTRLEVGDTPLLLARGDNLNVEVDQEGYRRTSGAIFYRNTGSGDPWQQIKVLADDAGRLRARLNKLSDSVELYAQAGDGRSAIRRVEVVDRPAVEQVTVRYVYPLYTGLEPELRAPGRGKVKALEGTRVRIGVRFNCPVSRAGLKALGSSSALTIDTQSRKRFAVGEFVVQADGSYSISPEADYCRDDASGKEHCITFKAEKPTRFSITALKDQAPKVTIDHPAGDMNVLPTALIPLRALAKDDFAIASALLSFGLSTREGEEAITLASTRFGTAKVPLNHAWDLAPLKLKPGMAVSYRVLASDRRPKPGPNVGSSDVHHLRVISRADFDDETARTKAAIHGGLNGIIRFEKANKGQVEDVHTKLKVGGKFDRDSRYKTTLAEGEQRAIARRTGALGQKVQNLRRRLGMNRASGAREDRELGRIAAELGNLERDDMPKAAEAIRSGRKSKQDRDAAARLAEAGGRQQNILKALDRLHAITSKWKQTDALLKMARALLARETGIARDTLSTARSGDFRAGDPAKLEDKAKSRLEFLRREQTDAAKDMSDLEEKMIGALEKLNDADSRTRIRIALKIAQDAEVSAKGPTAKPEDRRPVRDVMDTAATKIAALRLGSAAGEQKIAVGALTRIVRALAHKGKRDYDGIRRDLERARAIAVGARDRQRGHIADTRDAAGKSDSPDENSSGNPSSSNGKPDSGKPTNGKPSPGSSGNKKDPKKIAEEQDQTRDRTKRLRKLLEDLKNKHDLPGLKKPAATAGSASGSMGRASGKLGSGKPGDALPDEKDGRDKLDDIIDDIDDEIRKNDDDKRQEELFKVEKELREILAVHVRVMLKTQEVEDFRKAKPDEKLGRQHMKRLFEATREETEIAGRARATVKRLEDCPVFKWVLGDTADDMLEVRDELERRKTGQYVQEVERDVKRQLEELIAALKKERQKGPKKPPRPPSDAPPGNPPPPGKPLLVPELAELKMLRILQAQVNRKTKWVDNMVAKRPDRKLTGALRRYLERTAQKQGDVARLTMELTRKPARKAPEGPIDICPRRR